MMKAMKIFAAVCLAAVTLAAAGSGTVKAEPKAFDYLIPDADTRIYSADEIGIMSLQVTNYAKNEIYARHGRKFNSKELTEYFSEQPWYEGTVSPSQFDDSVLNSNEVENIRILSEREKMLSWDQKGYELDQEGYNTDEITEFLSDDYNILEGAEVYSSSGSKVIDADHFYLTAPETPAWEYIQYNRYGFEIYYPPAREGGFGGHVVSIVAYDLDDNSYEEAPHYEVIGTGAEKKFIAFYPTDVQFDWNNPDEGEAYSDLSDWAETMGENSTSSPFTVVDPDIPEETGEDAESMEETEEAMG